VANNLKLLARGTQVQKYGYSVNHRSDSFRTECVGFRSARGIEWYWFSKCRHGYTGQQGEKGRYLSREMSARVRKGLIGIRLARGIEWYRSQSHCRPVALSSSVRYGASRAPKPAGPRLNSPPRPSQWPGAGCFFFQPLPLAPSRPPTRSMP